MQHFMSTAGIAGFAIVFGLNLVNGNDPSKAVVSALLAALGFAVLTRSFMRKAFVQLHHSAFEQQQAAVEAVHAEAPSSALASLRMTEEAEFPPAEDVPAEDVPAA